MGSEKKIATVKKPKMQVDRLEKYLLAYQMRSEESQRKTEASQRKTEASQRKTEKALRELKESHQKLGKFVKENSRAIKRASGNFNTKWGDFLENLVEGDLVSLLRNWGFEDLDAEIHPIPKVIASNNDGTPKYELDLIVKNGALAFVVEVKTTLTIFDVDVFLGKLEVLKDDFSDYKNKAVYGCMAYINVEKETIKNPKTRKVKVTDALAYAQKNGLVTIRAPGGPANISTITNPKGFVPKMF